MNIEIKTPTALQHEIERLIDVHYGVEELVSFMKRYPQVYHIYLRLQRFRRGEQQLPKNQTE